MWCRKLLAAGADVGLRDGDGCTPADVSAPRNTSRAVDS